MNEWQWIKWFPSSSSFFFSITSFQQHKCWTVCFFTLLSRYLWNKNKEFFIYYFDLILLNPMWIWFSGFNRSKLRDCKKPNFESYNFPFRLWLNDSMQKSENSFVPSHWHAIQTAFPFHTSVRIFWHRELVLSLLLIPFDMIRVHTKHMSICVRCAVYLHNLCNVFPYMESAPKSETMAIRPFAWYQE